MFAAYDDLEIVSNDLRQIKVFPLVAVFRNEMYVISEFLRHYRSIGVERFIILDDRSDDGTREFLAEQKDVMIVQSKSRFGDIVSPNGRMPMPDMRALIVWRNVMMWKYAFDQWALMLDADEFLELPAGMTLSDVGEAADRERRRAVCGVMLDCYPKSILDLQHDDAFDADGEWFFGGQKASFAQRRWSRP